MRENLINRKTYKRIKKMDRQEMEKLLQDMHKEAFKAGTRANNNVDFRIWLSRLLKEVPGVGITIYNRIMTKAKEME